MKSYTDKFNLREEKGAVNIGGLPFGGELDVMTWDEMALLSHFFCAFMDTTGFNMIMTSHLLLPEML